MQKTKTKTVFFGSGTFAAVILAALLKADFLDLNGVVTQPDKPAGRKQEVVSAPVKNLLIRMNYPGKIFQPAALAVQADEILETMQPQLIIVADYGQILPIKLINYPQYHCLNVHGSLLPDLRGAVPVPLAILKGYKKTGVSIPVMTAGLDNGGLIATREMPIAEDDTTASLKAKLAESGAKLLVEILPDWIAGKITTSPQNETLATITERTDISKDKAEISAVTDYQLADRMVRAFYPWPIAWIMVDFNKKQERLKIFRAEPMKKDFPEKGKIYKSGEDLYLSLPGGSLRLLELQLAGKNKGSARDYWFLTA